MKETISGKEVYRRPGEWVRPLNHGEAMMARGGFYGSCNTIQAIWIASINHSIAPDDVIQALTSLLKKVPLLQVCVGKRNFSLWLKRLQFPIIDFGVCNNDFECVYEEQMNKPYDLYNGPLWRVRMVPLKGEETKIHKCVLVFSVHHVISDSKTNMFLCRETVAYLNSKCMNRPHDIDYQLLENPIDDSVWKSPNFKFAMKNFWKKIQDLLYMKYNSTTFCRSLSVPLHSQVGTRVIRDQLTEVETLNLINKCKEEKVTVNSCVVTVANLAVMKLTLDEVGEGHSVMKILNRHCVNIRRHYQANKKDVLGFHVANYELESHICMSDLNNFWRCARDFNQYLHSYLNDDTMPAKAMSLTAPSKIICGLSNFLGTRGKSTPNICHYVTSNMGNLKYDLPWDNVEDSIQIEDILRSATNELFGFPCLLTFHTFRDRLKLSMDYYTYRITRERVVTFFNLIVHYLRKLASNGQLNEIANNQ